MLLAHVFSFFFKITKMPLTFINLELKWCLVVSFIHKDSSIFEFPDQFHYLKKKEKKKHKYIKAYKGPTMSTWDELLQRRRKPWTIAPSFGRSYPSPSFKIFFKTFLSVVTSETIFHETNSTVIWMVVFGGTTHSSPPDGSRPFSPNPSIDQKWRKSPSRFNLVNVKYNKLKFCVDSNSKSHIVASLWRGLFLPSSLFSQLLTMQDKNTLCIYNLL